MSITDYTLNHMKDKFYPLCVENYRNGYRIIASTGLFNVHIVITYDMLKACRDMDALIELTKNKLNYKIELLVLEKFLNQTDRFNRIVTPLVPAGKSILLVHPMDRRPSFYTPQKRYNTMM
jgi:hypothetical protein